MKTIYRCSHARVLETGSVCNNTLLGLTSENSIIAKLYEENKQEKLKNGILKECLREKNHVKPKVMKSCKHVKQKLQDARDSGLRQMLVDIEARCNMFEKKIFA
ncbi:hypothetical protein PsorP6_012547 [Peronosclerospora sorghi]|uniref:Uncharacterized protein n=1 Tax=Peronosclerospora sorghi TaxID=230839 RepID=A0ACC0WHA0_9STRA|nr:hypothetical protein PsorP6_012547 [Peronosclerospora sorghi]